MKSIIVQVSEELHRTFKVRAAEQGHSMAAVLRQLILEWVDGEK